MREGNSENYMVRKKYSAEHGRDYQSSERYQNMRKRLSKPS